MALRSLSRSLWWRCWWLHVDAQSNDSSSQAWTLWEGSRIRKIKTKYLYIPPRARYPVYSNKHESCTPIPSQPDHPVRVPARVLYFLLMGWNARRNWKGRTKSWLCLFPYRKATLIAVRREEVKGVQMGERWRTFDNLLGRGHRLISLQSSGGGLNWLDSRCADVFNTTLYRVICHDILYATSCVEIFMVCFMICLQ